MVLGFLLSFVLAISAAADAEPPRYFGFVIVDAAHDDPNDAATTTNYLPEVAGFCNLADIAVFSPDESITTRIDAMRAVGIKPMILAPTLLFDAAPDPTTGSGTRLSLRNDAASRLATLVATNDLNKRAEDLAAIYLVDEPTWNGVSAADLQSAAAIVRTALPTVPIVIVEAYPVIDQLVVPQEADWIGFDRYAVGDPSRDPDWQNDLATLRTRKSRPDQKIVIIMESQWLPIYADFGFQPADMAIVARNYERAARMSGDCVALIGYTWPGGFEDPDQLGARNLPENVRETYEQIGRRITREPRDSTRR